MLDEDEVEEEEEEEEEAKFEVTNLGAAEEDDDEAVDDGPPAFIFTIDDVVRDVSTVGMGTFKIEFCKEFCWLV